MCIEIGSTREPAWQKEKRCIGKGKFCKQGISDYRNAVCSIYHKIVGDRDQSNCQSGTAHHIDRGEGFYFFEAFSKKYIHLLHT